MKTHANAAALALSMALGIAAGPTAARDAGRGEEGAGGMTGVYRLAGLPDQPLLIEGSLLVFRFSGATDDGEQGGPDRTEATSVHCTNVGSVDAGVEVQVFDFGGTVFVGSATIPPGHTRTFSTQNTTIYFEDVILGGPPGTGPIDQGWGQVLAVPRDIICTAQTLDPLGDPPAFVTGLEMFR